MSARALPLVLFALAPLACGTATANATSGPYASAIVGDDDAGPPARDAGAPYCDGVGPPIAIPGATSECTGDIAARTFRFAVCACRDVLVSGTLMTDSLATGASDGTGGSIGANGAVTANSDLDVRGSIWAAASGATTALHTVKAGAIHGDVHAGADVIADAPLAIDGALTLPTAANVTGATAAGGVVRGAITPPCDCSAPLDVASIVTAFAAANDDAAIGLSSASLAVPPAGTIPLPCGRYYFDAIDGDALHLALSGRTAIFVAGSLHLASSLAIDLAPGAELDLFVAGDLRLHDASIGDDGAPARARVYVGGSTFALDGTAHLALNLYAPHADVLLSGDQRMAGSLFVDSLQLSGAFTIRYDESILATEGCAPPTACGGGAACATDGDCCAPLVCRAGTCVADVR